MPGRSRNNEEKRDWCAWHQEYENRSSPLHQRLAIVQREIRRALPQQLDYPFLAISLCAGQGDDLVGVLKEYPHAARVRARLVDSEENNIAKLRKNAKDAGLHHLEAIHADAGYTRVYQGIVPADLVLLCGIFGNISDADIQNTIRCLPQLCKTGAMVIWTRSRRSPDLTPSIRRWFHGNGFSEIAFQAPDGVLFSVGAHRFEGQPRALEDVRLFTFTT
jgi:ubiquinone/menaquinone biosynthesis C-methylase UbiE